MDSFYQLQPRRASNTSHLDRSPPRRSNVQSHFSFLSAYATMNSKKPCLFTSVKSDRAYGPKLLDAPPHEYEPFEFTHRTRPFRINLLAADGDTLYFAYSTTHIARYRIYRSNGIILKALPAVKIVPPTTINNVVVANFDSCHGGRLLLMTGGSELSTDNGTLSILQLPTSFSDRSEKTGPFYASSVAYTYKLPMLSAWGLDVNEPNGLIAVSSNSHSVVLLTILHSRHIAHGAHVHGHEEITTNDDSSARQFRLFLVADPMRDIHSNNIPSVAFSRKGDLIASASIDTTFAIYSVRPSDQQPSTTPINHFLQRQTSRLLAQIGQMVHPADDFHSSTERAWAVHWVPDSFVCYLGRGADIPDLPFLRRARKRFDYQRSSEGWALNDSTMNVPQNIFQPDSHPVPHATDVVLYDDRIDHIPPHFQCANHRDADRRRTAPQHDHAEVPDQSVHTPPPRAEPLHKVEFNAGGQGEQKAPRDAKRLLLVCYEKLIELYEVSDNLTQLSDDCLLTGDEVELIDSISYYGIYGNLREMFTNVIEIPALRALVITGVSSGILVVRIVSGAGDDQTHGTARGKGWGSGPSLFVEEIFMGLNNLAGACVVERKSDCISTNSFELWMLALDGRVECRDLSSNRSIVDPSCII